MKINLLVIRTEIPELLKEQYEHLGFKFAYHKHQSGPFHFASENNGFVFEIYPFTKSMFEPEKNIRLGFTIENLKKKVNELKETNWIVKSEIKETEWGITCVLQDLDGRKIELKEESPN